MTLVTRRRGRRR